MDLLGGEFLSLDEAADSGAKPRTRLERTSSRAHAAIEFTLRWTSECGVSAEADMGADPVKPQRGGRSQTVHHTDIHVAGQLNLWRDYFIPELEAAVMGRPVGHGETASFRPGSLVPPHAPGDCLEIDSMRFNRTYRPCAFVAPRAGRFYPRGCIAGVKGIVSEDMTPLRIGRVDGERLTVDLNHPLSERPLELTARILDAWQAGAEHGGRAHDVAGLVAGHGPGMQARWRGEATDFFSDSPYRRGDPLPDPEFYAKARFADHLDRTALRQVAKLYGRLLPRGARVLDLMASWRSHLDAAEPARVAGLGLNAAELAANPLLDERAVHDLNAEPRLPFADASFDAAVCTVSVEYLTQPVEVFREVARVLRPGGRFVLAFSNRCFPPKAVQVWEEAHPFERPGLVLEYFHRAGGYAKLATFSLAGLPRPADDKYADRMPYSDPIHAVWGEKA